jgi:ABC-2 type transport system ATP-binding protein
MQHFEESEIEVLGHRVPGPVGLRQDVGVVLDHTCLVRDWRLSEVERAVRPLQIHGHGGSQAQQPPDFAGADHGRG